MKTNISPDREEELLDKVEELDAIALDQWVKSQPDKDALIAYIEILLTNGKEQ